MASSGNDASASHSEPDLDNILAIYHIVWVDSTATGSERSEQGGIKIVATVAATDDGDAASASTLPSGEPVACIAYFTSEDWACSFDCVYDEDEDTFDDFTVRSMNPAMTEGQKDCDLESTETLDENGNAFLKFEIDTGTQGYIGSGITLYAKREVVDGGDEDLTHDEQVALGLVEEEKLWDDDEEAEEEEEEEEED